jgi:hypothetical protein
MYLMTTGDLVVVVVVAVKMDVTHATTVKMADWNLIGLDHLRRCGLQKPEGEILPVD